MTVNELVSAERTRLESGGYTIYKESHEASFSLLIMFRDKGPEDHGGHFIVVTFNPVNVGDMTSTPVYVDLARQKVEMFTPEEKSDESI